LQIISEPYRSDNKRTAQKSTYVSFSLGCISFVYQFAIRYEASKMFLISLSCLKSPFSSEKRWCFYSRSFTDIITIRSFFLRKWLREGLKEDQPTLYLYRTGRTQIFSQSFSSNERSYHQTYKSKILTFSDVPVKNVEDHNPPFFGRRS
jgi:hypothetical protein